MKILICCQYYYPQNFSITRIAEGLVSRGNDVSVLTGKPDNGFGIIEPKYKDIIKEEINGVTVYRVDVSPCRKNALSLIKNYISYWRNSRKWVKNCKEKYDLVYSFSLSPVTILSPANLYKKLFNVPHISHVLDLWPESVVATHHTVKYLPMYWVYFCLSRNLYKHADKILIGSPSYERYFRKVLKIKNIPISFVPQPSLLEDVDIIPYQYKQKINILYAGNINKLQLSNYIVPAMKYITNDDVCFHIVGSGRYLKDLVREIEENGLHDRIIIHGRKSVQESAGYIKSADALFVPLSNKTFVGYTIPAKLIMGMAFSKPIIAMLDGDGKDVLFESKGAVFTSENHIELANAIDMMCALNEQERKRLGDNNYSYYSKHFNINNILDLIELSFSK